jgi:hypothetical protein
MHGFAEQGDQSFREMDRTTNGCIEQGQRLLWGILAIWVLDSLFVERVVMNRLPRRMDHDECSYRFGRDLSLLPRT